MDDQDPQDESFLDALFDTSGYLNDVEQWLDDDTTSSRAASPLPTAAQPPVDRELAITAAPRAAAVNSTRNRRRAELMYLRDTVAGLELRVASLKKATRPSSGTATTDNSVHRALELSRAWRATAMRQLEQRRQAEVVNRSLRRQLEDQLRLAKRLERLLKRSPQSEELLFGTGEVTITSDRDGDDQFQSLRADLVAMHHSLDTVFADGRFHGAADGSMRDVQVKMDSAKGTTVTIQESKVIPFALQATLDVMWRQTTERNFGQMHSTTATDSDDVVTKEFAVDVAIGTQLGRFRGRLAAQKIITARHDGSAIILWSALIDPVAIAAKSMDGLVLSHKGWTVLRPLAGVTPRTLVQSQFELAVPRCATAPTDTDDRVGVLTDFALSAVDLQQRTGVDSTERLLFRGRAER